MTVDGAGASCLSHITSKSHTNGIVLLTDAYSLRRVPLGASKAIRQLLRHQYRPPSSPRFVIGSTVSTIAQSFRQHSLTRRNTIDLLQPSSHIESLIGIASRNSESTTTHASRTARHIRKSPQTQPPLPPYVCRLLVFRARDSPPSLGIFLRFDSAPLNTLWLLKS